MTGDTDRHRDRYRLALKRLLVCSWAGHKWESDGMTFYRCQRCSKREEAYEVNLGYA